MKVLYIDLKFYCQDGSGVLFIDKVGPFVAFVWNCVQMNYIISEIILVTIYSVDFVASSKLQRIASIDSSRSSIRRTDVDQVPPIEIVDAKKKVEYLKRW